MSTKKIFYDGDYTQARAIGPIRSEQPFPQDPATKIYRQAFAQLKTSWTLLAISDPGPAATGTSYLIEETPLEDYGAGGLVKWDRVWANIPNTRTERQEYIYAYQYIVTITHSDPNIPASQSVEEVPISVDSTLTYSYAITAGTPAAARLPFKYVSLSSGVTTTVKNNGGVVGLAEAGVRRWKGNIYETVERTVPPTMVLF